MVLKRSTQVFLAAILVIGLAGITYAFAASNSISTRKLGDGAGSILTYSTIHPHYELNAANPQLIDSVTFNLSADAVSVNIKLDSAGTTWYACTITHATPWPVSCNTPGAIVQNSDQFRVIVSSN